MALIPGAGRSGVHRSPNLAKGPYGRGRSDDRKPPRRQEGETERVGRARLAQPTGTEFAPTAPAGRLGLRLGNRRIRKSTFPVGWRGPAKGEDAGRTLLSALPEGSWAMAGGRAGVAGIHFALLAAAKIRAAVGSAIDIPTR